MEQGNGSGGRVGRYTLLQVLGEGGMGVVHLAGDPDGRRVAIKVLRPQVAADRTAVRRLAREVDTMRRVHSPNVAEILDADVTAERPYIVTQFVPGRTLEEHVQEHGPLSGRPLQRLAYGLANALAAIHGAGVIHRDLKPGNVMLPGTAGGEAAAPDGEPVLIDFGIAQGLDATRLTATGLVIGTPGYLAPEIIEGEEAGPPSDVHAWAGTLVFAATGRPPFGQGTFESIFYKIMQGTPDLSGAPEAILPLIRAAMARHPAERPTAINLTQLARRIDLDATITDQTRVDRHLSEFGLAPRPSAPGQDKPFDPDATTADPMAGLSTDAVTAVGGPAALDPDPSAWSSAATLAQTGDSWGAATAKDSWQATTTPEQAWGVPPEQRAPAQEGMSQPRDYVGMLPPVAPPPPVPQRPPVQPPYTPPPDYPQQYQGYPGQPGGYPDQAQRGGAYGGDQAGPGQGPGQRPAAGGQAAKPERRKPFALYRLCSLATLGVILGGAAIAPVVVVALALALAVLLRAADKSAKGMESKRVRRGPGTADVVSALATTPLHLPGAVMKTALWGGLHVFAGVALVGVLMATHQDMSVSRAVAYGAMAVLAVHFLGPGSGAPRRQAARLWGAFLPVAGMAVVMLVALVAGAAVLLSTSTARQPTLSPVHVEGSTTLHDWQQSLRSKVPGLR